MSSLCTSPSSSVSYYKKGAWTEVGDFRLTKQNSETYKVPEAR